MTREEAQELALDALQYVLDNDTDYLSEEAISDYAEANRILNAIGRLEYLRGQLRAQCISWGELAELQGLAEHIEPDDVELREAAGLPEHP